jgi:O-antigen ligase
MRALENKLDVELLLFDVKNLIYFLVFVTMPFSILINGYLISSFVLGLIIIYLKSNYKNDIAQNRQILILSISFLSFYLLEFFSIIFFATGESEFYRLEKHLIISLFPILILLLKLEISDTTFKRAMKLFVLAILLICLFSEYHNLLSLKNDGKPIIHLFRWRYSGNNIIKYFPISSNYLSLYIGVAIVFLLKQNGEGLKRFQNVTNIFFIFFLLFVLLHLAARSIIIAVGVSIVLIVFKYIAKTKISKALFLSVFILSIFLTFNNFRYLNTKFTKNTFDNPDNLQGKSIIEAVPRLARWKSILIKSDQIGFTGVGVSDAQKFISTCYLESGLIVAFDNRYNAHNQFIQTYVELGVLGLISLTFIFLVPLWSFAREGDYYSLSVVLIFLFFGFTESFFLRQKGIVLFTILAFSMLLIKQSKLANSKNNLNE